MCWVGVQIPNVKGRREHFEGENGPTHDMPGHVRQSIYSKRLNRGQNGYGADADRFECTRWVHVTAT